MDGAGRRLGALGSRLPGSAGWEQAEGTQVLSHSVTTLLTTATRWWQQVTLPVGSDSCWVW